MTGFKDRQELMRFIRLLYDRKYLSGMDGNVSIRLGSGYLVTPAARNKGLILETDLVELAQDAQPLNRSQKASTEFQMHLEVYRQRPEIMAVVHCHPVYATTIAASTIDLDSCLMTESILGLGTVPKAPLALPSTSGLVESIRPFIQKTNALLLQNHGALSYGKTLEEAYSRMESVEHFAQIAYLLRTKDLENLIDSQMVSDLEALRPKYGLDSHYTPCRTKEK